MASEQADDPVNPAHYKQGAIELIDALRSELTREEFKGFLKGQVTKYLWRARHKGSEATDYQKAAWYLARLNELMEGE